MDFAVYLNFQCDGYILRWYALRDSNKSAYTKADIFFDTEHSL